MASIREQRKAKIKEALEHAHEAYEAGDYPTALKVLMPYRSDAKVQRAISTIEKARGKATSVEESNPSGFTYYFNTLGIPVTVVCGLLFFLGVFYSRYPPAAPDAAAPVSTVAATSMPAHADVYYSNIPGAYVRACTEGNCEILASLPAGEEVDFIAFAEGAEISGSTVWYRVRLSDGREGYIHSTVVSEIRPTPAPTSRPIYLEPQATQQPSSSHSIWNCNVDYDCGDFASCSDIYDYTSSCPGDPSNLDSDGDGYACEDRCR